MTVAAYIAAVVVCVRLRANSVEWSVEGDPMEVALVALAMKAGYDPGNERAEWPGLDNIPFDAGHRFIATSHKLSLAAPVASVKGGRPRCLWSCATDRRPWKGWSRSTRPCGGTGSSRSRRAG